MKWNKKEQRPKDDEIILLDYTGQQYWYNKSVDTVTDSSDNTWYWDKIVEKWVSFDELISTIEEPTKITIQDFDGCNDWYCEWYKCPNCGKKNITRSFIFCPDCGKSLEWDVIESDDLDSLTATVFDTFKKANNVSEIDGNDVYFIIKHICSETVMPKRECEKEYIKCLGNVEQAIKNLKGNKNG